MYIYTNTYMYVFIWICIHICYLWYIMHVAVNIVVYTIAFLFYRFINCYVWT